MRGRAQLFPSIGVSSHKGAPISWAPPDTPGSPPSQRAPLPWDKPHGFPLAGGHVGCILMHTDEDTPQRCPSSPPRGSLILQGTKGDIPLRTSPASRRLHRIASPGCPHRFQVPSPGPPLPASALGARAAPTPPAVPHPPGALTQLSSEQTPRQAPMVRPLHLPGAGPEVGGGEVAPGGAGAERGGAGREGFCRG